MERVSSEAAWPVIQVPPAAVNDRHDWPVGSGLHEGEEWGQAIGYYSGRR